MAPVKGSCVCGDWTYEYSGGSFDVVVCNCHPCQKLYGASFNLITHEDNFHKQSGTDWNTERLGDSGKTVINHACAKCGAVMWVEGDALRPNLVIKATSFDDPKVLDQLKPVSEIYCRNRPAQIPEVLGVEHKEGAP